MEKSEDWRGWYERGNALAREGRWEQAIDAFRRSLKLHEENADAHNNIAIVLHKGGRSPEAIVHWRRALALRPDFAFALNNLGTALRMTGAIDEAIAAHREAVKLRPVYPSGWVNLGVALHEKRALDEALTAIRRALAQQAVFPGAWLCLGRVLRDQDHHDEAMEAHRRAIEQQPNFADAYSDLGNVLKDTGQIAEAMASYEQAMRIMPNRALYYSNRLYAMQFDPSFDAGQILGAARQWDQQHAARVARLPELERDLSAGRRLRVGYFSPDLRRHVVGWNLLPLLKQHDHERFEIFCYFSHNRPDAMTATIRECADGWREVAGLDDEAAARLIREDGIDILVDLALHMARGRLLVFARKPAPVQVTYLGYCGTTGLGAMDYRLSDPYLDPSGTDLAVYSERTVRLPRSYWCYQPGHEVGPVAGLPALGAGYVTFGCLNNFAKVSAPAQELWARVLAAVPGSRLLVHSPPGAHREKMLGRFAEHGVGGDRIEFVGHQIGAEYIATYNRIDIALDPLPYGGGITSCDAMWMGAPVVTLIGKTSVGRAGCSILNNVGLEELIAGSEEDYVRIAAGLALDLERLRVMRSTMRERMIGSPLMDARRFARDVEGAYGEMWGELSGRSV